MFGFDTQSICTLLWLYWHWHTINIYSDLLLLALTHTWYAVCFDIICIYTQIVLCLDSIGIDTQYVLCFDIVDINTQYLLRFHIIGIYTQYVPVKTHTLSLYLPTASLDTRLKLTVKILFRILCKNTRLKYNCKNTDLDCNCQNTRLEYNCKNTRLELT